MRRICLYLALSLLPLKLLAEQHQGHSAEAEVLMSWGFQWDVSQNQWRYPPPQAETPWQMALPKWPEQKSETTQSTHKPLVLTTE